MGSQGGSLEEERKSSACWTGEGVQQQRRSTDKLDIKWFLCRARLRPSSKHLLPFHVGYFQPLAELLVTADERYNSGEPKPAGRRRETFQKPHQKNHVADAAFVWFLKRTAEVLETSRLGDVSQSTGQENSFSYLDL